MLATPENQVYRGIEGTGAAQIFGREGNPMRAYQMRKADIDRKRAIQAEQEKLQKQKRDKQMWDMINVDPEAAFEPFNRQVMDAADAHRKKITDYFERGGNPDDPDFQRQSKRGWDEVNSLARRSQYIKNTIQETRDTIKKNPYLQEEYYHSKINDLYMDPQGNALPLDQVDLNAINSIYKNDPMGFNEAKYRKDFMNGLNDNMSNYITQAAQNNGILTNDIETKWKGGLYTPDESNPLGVKTDANGKPILNITPEFVNSYTNSETARLFYDKIAQEQGVGIADVVRNSVETTGGGLQQNIRSSFSRNPSGDFWKYQKQRDWETAGTDRFKKVSSLISAVNPDGTITPEAQSVLGALRNAKSLDGNVVNAEIIPGSSTPGTVDFHGQKVPTSPSNRIVYSVKTADRGYPKIQEINLDSPDSFEAINGLLNASPSETSKYSTNDLTSITGKNLGDLYGATNNTSGTKEEAARIENEAVNRVMSAPIGSTIPQLTNKSYGGKKIIAAKKIETEPPNSFLGFNLGTWGQKEAIELELEGGDIVEVTDPEEIRKIHKGGSSGTEEMVPVLSPDGTPGSIPKSKLEAAIKAGYTKR